MITTTAILRTAWDLSAEEIQELSTKLDQIQSLKRDIFAEAKRPAINQNIDPPDADPTNVQPSTSPPLPTRGPLRPPKPGSLRHAIHEILRSAPRALKRAEIIAAIARERGVQIDTTLKVKVGDVLTCAHDPLIRRVAYGTYTYAQTQHGL